MREKREETDARIADQPRFEESISGGLGGRFFARLGGRGFMVGVCRLGCCCCWLVTVLTLATSWQTKRRRKKERLRFCCDQQRSPDGLGGMRGKFGRKQTNTVGGSVFPSNLSLGAPLGLPWGETKGPYPPTACLLWQLLELHTIMICPRWLSVGYRSGYYVQVWGRETGDFFQHTHTDGAHTPLEAVYGTW